MAVMGKGVCVIPGREKRLGIIILHEFRCSGFVGQLVLAEPL